MTKLVFFGLDEHEKDVIGRAFAGEAGYEIALHTEPLTIENVSLAHGAEGIGVFVMSRVTREVIDRLPNLKMVAAMSTGFDHIDSVACREKNIAVCNVPHYGESTVAEFAFGLILALARKFRPTFERTDRGDFSRAGLQGMDLAGKTLGLIGTGRIGSHLARIAHAAEMEVIAYDLRPNPALTEEYGVRYMNLDDVLRVPGKERPDILDACIEDPVDRLPRIEGVMGGEDRLIGVQQAETLERIPEFVLRRLAGPLELLLDPDFFALEGVERDSPEAALA